MAASVLGPTISHVTPAGAVVVHTAHPDFNHDGFADVVVNIDQEDIGRRVDAGEIEVLYGASTTARVGTAKQYFSNTTAGIQGGVVAGGRFGENWTTGDFNHDGYDDLAIGEFGATVDGATSAGQVHVLYGSKTGLTLAHYQNINEDTASVPGTAQTGDMFGHSLTSGDFNHDGIADLAVSVPGKDLNGETQAGAVHVFFGSATGLMVSGPHTGQRFFHMGPSGALGTGLGDAAKHGALFGSPVFAGDWNGDGISDLAIGVQGEVIGDGITPGPSLMTTGGFYVLYGDATSASFGTTHPLYTENTLGTPSDGSRLGAYFAAGDYNGDGIQDLAVGADGKTIGAATDSGAVYVLYGTHSILTTTNHQLWTLQSAGIGAPGIGDNFGDALAAGDYNGDGRSDLVITVDRRDAPGKIDIGTAFVLYGHTGTGLTTAGRFAFSENTKGMPGPVVTAGDQFASLVRPYDWNHDGYTDLYVAAAGRSFGPWTHGGVIYLMSGGPKGLTTTGTRMLDGNTTGVATQVDQWFGGT
jgi:hypothetical protein